MGHAHSHLTELLAFIFAALIPCAAFLAIAGAWWESHRRAAGRAARGAPRTIVAARFVSATD